MKKKVARAASKTQTRISSAVSARTKEQIFVYVLNHEYTRENGDCESKEIGIFSTRARAKAAIGPLKKRPGFRDYPNGFKIYKYKLDTDLAWTEGFVRGNPHDPLPGTLGYDKDGFIIKKK
jgi:hypothetical protein